MRDLDKTDVPIADIQDTMHAAPVRAAYSQPKLIVYGTVSEFTKGSQTRGSDGGGGSTRRRSARELKQNIERVGTHPLGFGLYVFEYKDEFRHLCGTGRMLGVLIDEVEAIAPETISIGQHGYKVVDYTALGIHLA